MKRLFIMILTVLLIGSTVYADAPAKESYEKDFEKTCDIKEMTKEAFMEGLEAKGITVEEYKVMVIEKYEKLAANQGMTLAEYKATISTSKKCCKK